MEQEKKRKNILGYDVDTMNEAKSRSKYFVYASLALIVFQWLLDKPPIALSDPYWYATILSELFGFLIGGAILAQFIAWIVRSVVEKFSDKQRNKFDYFATTFLIMTILGFISKLFG